MIKILVNYVIVVLSLSVLGCSAEDGAILNADDQAEEEKSENIDPASVEEILSLDVEPRPAKEYVRLLQATTAARIEMVEKMAVGKDMSLQDKEKLLKVLHIMQNQVQNLRLRLAGKETLIDAIIISGGIKFNFGNKSLFRFIPWINAPAKTGTLKQGWSALFGTTVLMTEPLMTAFGAEKFTETVKHVSKDVCQRELGFLRCGTVLVGTYGEISQKIKKPVDVDLVALQLSFVRATDRNNPSFTLSHLYRRPFYGFEVKAGLPSPFLPDVTGGMAWNFAGAEMKTVNLSWASGSDYAIRFATAQMPLLFRWDGDYRFPRMNNAEVLNDPEMVKQFVKTENALRGALDAMKGNQPTPLGQ